MTTDLLTAAQDQLTHALAAKKEAGEKVRWWTEELARAGVDVEQLQRRVMTLESRVAREGKGAEA